MSEKIGNLGYPEEEFVRKHGEEAQTVKYNFENLIIFSLLIVKLNV